MKTQIKNQSKESFREGVRFYLPSDIMARWNPDIHAAESDDAATINVYDVVGEDFFGSGKTEKIVSAVLRRNKGKDVTVNINSPGGDFFQGVAIYNLLKEHDGNVSVRVVGMAASAASVIAMAGDTIKIAESGFLMIHNAWNVIVGNKHEMRDMAEVLAQFDESMIGIYSKHTGISEDDITAMMDAETWINGTDAVAQDFADQFLDSDEVELEENEKAQYNSSLKEVDVILAKAGKTRSERRHLLQDLTSTPGATVKDEATPGAGNTELSNAVVALLATINRKR